MSGRPDHPEERPDYRPAPGEIDARRVYSPSRSGKGRRAYVDLPAGRLSPAAVMSIQVSKPAVGAYCGGLAPLPFAAARLRWARDRTALATLRPELLRSLRVAAANEDWYGAPAPKCGTCGAALEMEAYLAALVDTALEEFYARAFTAEQRLARLGCSESTWHRRHRARYQPLLDQLVAWLRVAAIVIRERQDDG